MNDPDETSGEDVRDDVTGLLIRWSEGDAEALDRLLPIVYSELRSIADHYLRKERPGHTLQPTALVHEAYLRIVKTQGLEWQNREQFFGIAANLMRQILVDHARTARAQKRGGNFIKTPLDERSDPGVQLDSDILLLDEALTKFSMIDPQAARIVELRYFTGLTIDETARVMGCSPTSVKREWATARAWLHREIGRTSQKGPMNGLFPH